MVLASQRGRMLGAMADAVASKGYAGTTVADVVAGAGVSRKTFYEHFRDKEECFLAAFDAGVDLLLAAIVGAQPPATTRGSGSCEPACGHTSRRSRRSRPSRARS